jgi:sulfite exporter TauE/SafE
MPSQRTWLILSLCGEAGTIAIIILGLLLIRKSEMEKLQREIEAIDEKEKEPKE